APREPGAQGPQPEAPLGAGAGEQGLGADQGPRSQGAANLAQLERGQASSHLRSAASSGPVVSGRVRGRRPRPATSSWRAVPPASWTAEVIVPGQVASNGRPV